MRVSRMGRAVIAFGAAVGAYVVVGSGTGVVPPFAGPVLAQDSARVDTAVRRAFRAVLDREPSDRERMRYRRFVLEEGWTEADIRKDLKERTDYKRHSSQGAAKPEVVIQRAYRDVLGRDPDAEGLRTYRSRIVNEGWTEQDVREALRRSDEYGVGDTRTASADRIVRRAYQDILQREPDPAGLQEYRRNILDEGWEENDVRRALRRSVEKRQQRQGVGTDQAAEIVRRAYLSVLSREPDGEGMREYTSRILNDGWTERQVVNALRGSEEYRIKHR